MDESTWEPTRHQVGESLLAVVHISHHAHPNLKILSSRSHSIHARLSEMWNYSTSCPQCALLTASSHHIGIFTYIYLNGECGPILLMKVTCVHSPSCLQLRSGGEIMQVTHRALTASLYRYLSFPFRLWSARESVGDTNLPYLLSSPSNSAFCATKWQPRGEAAASTSNSGFTAKIDIIRNHGVQGSSLSHPSAAVTTGRPYRCCHALSRC